MAHQVQRKIQFYRASVGVDAAGRLLPFHAGAALKVIPPPGTNYLEEADWNALCSWTDRSNSLPYRFRLARVRRSSLPLIEEGGALSALAIPTTSGLAETVHVCFFRENVVGILYNHYGPRVTRLAAYLKAHGGSHAAGLRFDALMDPDIQQRLDGIREVRVLRLGLRRAPVMQEAEMDASVQAMLETALKLGDAERVEVVLRPERYSKSTLGQRALRTIRRLARREDLRHIADTFEVEAELADDTRETINVLQAYIFSEETVLMIDERTRALSDMSAYAAIESAYNHRSDAIERAASLGALPARRR